MRHRNGTADADDGPLDGGRDSQAGASAAPASATPQCAENNGSNPVTQRADARTLTDVYHSVHYMLSVAYLRFMDVLPEVVSAMFLPTEDLQWAALRERLTTDHVRPFDSSKREDMRLLELLWAAHARVMFSDAAFAAVDTIWKEMGFQDTDPVKDFRGGGRLSLEQLIYLASTHPQDWNAMVGGDFLAAAAGINVSLRLMSILEVGQGRIVGPTSTKANAQFTARQARAQLLRFMFDDDADAALQKLNEVYCAIMRLLFLRWTQSSRDLMQFNTVLSKTYEEAERLLYVCTSLQDFCQLL